MKKHILLISLFSALLLTLNVFAEPVSTGYFNSTAIGGHDTTAYYSSSKSTEGEKRFLARYKDANWYFTSAAQRDLFLKNPSKYAPAYNGFCSNALALGEGLVRTDGTVWHIFGDKLHLFYAKRGKVSWQQGDYEELKDQADLAWEQILSEQ